ncbi:hypothetical protein SB6416_03411 [Klebsiella pasteurii]|nr:hypothetical protein SB6416_03411 [Klebsiella pasteurii]
MGNSALKGGGLLKIREEFGKGVTMKRAAGEFFTAGKFATFKLQDQKPCSCAA